jgi:hypothetical protein
MAASLPYDVAMAQAAPGGTLRVGMTASAVPLPNGVPDQGAEWAVTLPPKCPRS